jgi:hypothetical protein
MPPLQTNLLQINNSVPHRGYSKDAVSNDTCAVDRVGQHGGALPGADCIGGHGGLADKFDSD